MNTAWRDLRILFYPHVGQVTIEGPFNPEGVSDTASRRKIFVCRPGGRREEGRAATSMTKPRAPAASCRRSQARISSPGDACGSQLLMEFYRPADRRRLVR